MSRSFVLEAIADSALLLRFAPTISAANTARVVAVADALREARLPGIVDVVPGYASVTLVVADDMTVKLDAIAGRVHEIADAADRATRADTRLVEIPVRYGGDAGPDLEPLARQLKLTPEDLVARHTAPEYVVAMVGFLPGFPYLIGLDPALESPRHATPRLKVPAGSVGIGGAQTGVYPFESPGGWQLIGLTTTRLFDPAAPRPSLLEPGDRVRFKAVDR